MPDRTKSRGEKEKHARAMALKAVRAICERFLDFIADNGVPVAPGQRAALVAQFVERETERMAKQRKG